MSSTKNKKRSAAAAGALAAAFAVPLIALAVVYHSSTKRNEFAPAKLGIEVEEKATAAETATHEYTFVLSESGNYSTDKLVKVRAAGDSTACNSELRVKLVPMWYKEDSSDTVCGSIGNLSDFRYQRLNEDGTALLFLNGYNEVIVTCYLDDHWEEKWEYNSAKEYFVYTDDLTEGEITSALLSSVELSKAVYDETEGYELHIDVLADTIQSDANAADERW